MHDSPQENAQLPAAPAATGAMPPLSTRPRKTGLALLAPSPAFFLRENLKLRLVGAR